MVSRDSDLVVYSTQVVLRDSDQVVYSTRVVLRDSDQVVYSGHDLHSSWDSQRLKTVYQANIPILHTKKAAAQNEVALTYHKVRGLYFLAVVFAATII